MTDLILEREFKTTPERLFRAVTTRAELVDWFCPGTLTTPEDNIDLSRKGPWFILMVGDEGQRYKVSGHVTHVDPPKSVGFTWGWHDAEDQRGHESHVTFRVEKSPDGAKLTIDHRDLSDDAQGDSHTDGWTKCLDNLENYLG